MDTRFGSIMPYELFEHTADLGLRITAATPELLYADAARALFSAIVGNLEDVRAVETRSYRITGADPEYLLFDWLTECLYTCDTERLLLSQFDVRSEPGGIAVTARGEPIDPARHRMEHEVKAITYHGLAVRQSGGQWLAEVIVDI
jgi:SHS2 domain-containing protein